MKDHHTSDLRVDSESERETEETTRRKAWRLYEQTLERVWNSQFGLSLERRLDAADIRKRDIASELQVHVTAISHLCRGKSGLTGRRIAHLIERYEVIPPPFQCGAVDGICMLAGHLATESFDDRRGEVPDPVEYWCLHQIFANKHWCEAARTHDTPTLQRLAESIQQEVARKVGHSIAFRSLEELRELIAHWGGPLLRAWEILADTDHADGIDVLPEVVL